MLMDIASPAELLRVETATFAGGRRQAYLTFINESERVIESISGLFTLLDDDGHEIEKRRLSFDELSLSPLETSTCHLALDGYPPFDDMRMVLEGVIFQDNTIWEMNPSRLLDCTPPALPEGPERVALISLAGADAVCFPERRELYWVCVCGRFNRLRWLNCRRCSRGRDETLAAYRPGQVLEVHTERRAEVRERDNAMLRERAAKKAEMRRRAAENEARRVAQEQSKRRRTSFAVMAALFVIAAGGTYYFLTAGRSTNGGGQPSQLQTQALEGSAVDPLQPTIAPIDYLDPV